MTTNPFRLRLFCAGLALSGAAWAQDRPKAADQPVQAMAEMKNAAGDPLGTITLTATAHGVTIEGTLDMVPPGTHGIHIHQNGVCQGPGFDSAGGHFNPAGKKHGKMASDGPHNGDLDNFTVDSTQHVKIDTADNSVSLTKAGPESLLKEGGTSIVIHGAADDYKTDPSGNSGSRIACGVIRLKNQTETNRLDTLTTPRQ